MSLRGAKRRSNLMCYSHAARLSVVPNVTAIVPSYTKELSWQFNRPTLSECECETPTNWGRNTETGRVMAIANNNVRLAIRDGASGRFSASGLFSVIPAEARIQSLDPGSKPVPDYDPGSGVTLSFLPIGQRFGQSPQALFDSGDEWNYCRLRPHSKWLSSCYNGLFYASALPWRHLLVPRPENPTGPGIPASSPQLQSGLHPQPKTTSMH